MAQPSLQLGEQKQRERGGSHVAVASTVYKKLGQLRSSSGDLASADIEGVCGETSDDPKLGGEVVSEWSKTEKRGGRKVESNEIKGGRKTGWNVCSFFSVGRLKGGTPESDVLEEGKEGNSRLVEVRRPEGWKYWEEDKTEQRPAPLVLPRSPDMEYANMTANAVSEEGAAEVFSPLKDK